MKTLKEYEEEGFVGQDASLEISLFEYGIIWKRETPIETRFIYGLRFYDGEYTSFDSSSMSLDSYRTGFWFEKDSDNGLFEYLGQTREELLATDDFSTIVPSLVMYYGHEEIFGTSYTAGFRVKK